MRRSYPEFVNSFSRIGRVLAPLLSMTPPSIDQPTQTDLWHLGKVGLAFRGLGKKDEYRLLRWAPMAVADLVSEWFETELLRATVAARGIHGAFAGPWSAGTSLGLLWQAAMDGSALGSASYPKGGMGGLSHALANAAKAAGAEIRTSARVSQISWRLWRQAESRARRRRGDRIARGCFERRSTHDVSESRRSDRSRAELPFEDAQLSRAGRGCEDQSRASMVCRAFRGVKTTNDAKLSGRIHIGPEIDYLERAFDASKYGEFSTDPYLDINIPSLGDPSLAPAGKHVMSIHVQFAPYK